MTRFLLVVLAFALGILGPGPAGAQGVRARSAAYLFLATAGDVRAVWVNPAGIVTVPSASIMAEIALDRQTTDELRVSQWSAGFASRGLSFGYRRNVLADSEDLQVFRATVGLPFTGGAVGGSFTIYESIGTQRALDFGVRYRLARPLEVAAAIHNIGRPDVVTAGRLPVTLAGGLAWYPLASLLELAAETHVAEGIDGAPSDVRHRFGARLAVPVRMPVSAFAAVDVEGDFGVEGWAVGLAVGGPYRGVAVASGSGAGGVAETSLTALAIRALGGR